MTTPNTIHLLIEEIETGSWPDGSTYCVLGAHRSAKGADDAMAKWRSRHGEPPHAAVHEDDDGWCSQCGCSASVERVELCQ